MQYLREEVVPSIKFPQQLVLRGFEQADEAAHMIQWLRMGPDFRRFVAKDVETELYAQDPGAQLLEIDCTEQPKYETKASRHSADGRQAILQAFSATFPLLVRVRAGNGSQWELRVRHQYQATGIDTTQHFEVRLSFHVEGAREMAS